MANPRKVSRRASFADGTALQIVQGSGTRVNATAGAVSTAEAALPAGSAGGLLIIRATDAIWLRMGATGVGAAAADANSILFMGGEAVVPTPDSATHFRVLRVGAADVAVQFESVSLEATS